MTRYFGNEWDAGKRGTFIDIIVSLLDDILVGYALN